jgi:two-component system alkaline phosphatase synthesis response regulator PhoP
MQQILVVDDELKITRLVRDYLEVAGFSVDVARDGPSAMAAARRNNPDLIVLDLGLPGMDGLEVTRALRRTSNVPIIILTARVDETDRIVGLEMGADDYVLKPFSPKELVARVRAVLRRMGATTPEVIRAGALTIDLGKRTVDVGRGEVSMTATEFDIVATLARSPGRVFTRSQILDEIQGMAFESRSVDAHVKNIRKKIEPDPHRPRHVITVHGVGYKFAG